MTPTFADFIAARTGRSAWVREPGLSLYVRRRSASSPRVDFVIANCDADEPGRGALTRFLDAWEPTLALKFECVHNPRLAAYLERRGYTRCGFYGDGDMPDPDICLAHYPA